MLQILLALLETADMRNQTKKVLLKSIKSVFSRALRKEQWKTTLILLMLRVRWNLRAFKLKIWRDRGSSIGLHTRAQTKERSLHLLRNIKTLLLNVESLILYRVTWFTVHLPIRVRILFIDWYFRTSYESLERCYGWSSEKHNSNLQSPQIKKLRMAITSVRKLSFTSTIKRAFRPSSSRNLEWKWLFSPPILWLIYWSHTTRLFRSVASIALQH